MESSSSSSPEYVGFWKRFLAFIIDSLILMVIIGPLLVAIYGREYFLRSDASPGFVGLWDFLIQVVLPAIAVILFWKYQGATPGKMAVSAKIVDARSGGTPSTGRLIARYFAYIISMLPLFLGFAWIAIDRRKQAWHDKIAGTVVITDDD